MKQSRAVALLIAIVTIVSGSICAPLCGAQAMPQPETTVGAALRSMASRAHDVFIGQVVAIERKGGVVAVTFRLDQSLAGEPASTLTMREWAGLCPPGEQRYFLGERALVFVHAASSAGLSSPVDGADGVVPVLAAEQPGQTQLDVRRLDARVLRAQHEPLATADTATISLADGIALVRGCRNPVWAEPSRRSLPAGFRSAAPERLEGRLAEPQPPFVGDAHIVWQKPADATENANAH